MLYIDSRIARPIATSAAAIAIAIAMNTQPLTSPYWDAAATKFRFAALSISSIHINTTIAFL